MVLALVAVWLTAAALEDPDVVVFYREGCNDCRHLDRVLEELLAEYPTLNVRHIEEAEPDAELMWVLAAEYGVFPTTFPVVFVGDDAIVGIGLEKELRLRSAARDCVINGCESPLPWERRSKVPWTMYVIGGLVAVILLIWLLE